jgi:DDE superfamily endonuclease
MSGGIGSVWWGCEKYACDRKQPVAQVNCRFQWLWLDGFVHPQSGETYWWILPKVNMQLFNRVLADFASHFGLGQHKRILLLLDGAGWHTSELLEVPEGVDLIFMPPNSPELQPAERLWPLTHIPHPQLSQSEITEIKKESLHKRKLPRRGQLPLVKSLVAEGFGFLRSPNL